VRGQKFRGLSEYENLKEAPMPWPKDDNWRIAREMNWDELKDTDLARFLELL
jgi:hypothetical protein